MRGCSNRWAENMSAHIKSIFGLVAACLAAASFVPTSVADDLTRFEFVSISVTSGKDFKEVVPRHRPKEDGIDPAVVTEIFRLASIEEARRRDTDDGEFFPDLSGAYIAVFECRNKKSKLYARIWIRLDDSFKLLNKEFGENRLPLTLQFLKKLIRAAEKN